MQREIGYQRCTCGHQSCRDYWLVGIGKFVQGSGFTEEEANLIADLLNAHGQPQDRDLTMSLALGAAVGEMRSAARLLRESGLPNAAASVEAAAARHEELLHAEA